MPSLFRILQVKSHKLDRNAYFTRHLPLFLFICTKLQGHHGFTICGRVAVTPVSEVPVSNLGRTPAVLTETSFWFSSPVQDNGE